MSALTRLSSPVARFMGANDDTAVSGTEYHAYIDCYGIWYIVKMVTAANITTVTYAEGDNAVNAYATAWTNRAIQEYKRFDELRLIKG